MGLEGEPVPIQLHPWQVVDSDPDGLIEHDRKWLEELRKPRTIQLPIFYIIKSPNKGGRE